MRRWIFVIVATIIAGKIFATALIKLFPSTTSEVIQTLALDKFPLPFKSHMVMDESPTERLETLPPPLPQIRLPKMIVPVKAPEPKAVINKADPVVKKVDEDKKEQERRKERKKKLEELTNKKQPTPDFSVQRDTIVSPDRNPVYGGSYAAAAGQTQYIPAKNPPSGTVSTTAVPPTTAQSQVDLASITTQLVNHPTAAAMRSFMSLYGSGKISINQYFQVLTAMQKSQVTTARKYAVEAAATQQSSQAFQLLADAKKTETDPQIRALATQDLLAYKDVKSLDILSVALSLGDINAKIEASETLDLIAHTFSPGNTSPEILTKLRPFVDLLKPLAHDATQTQLQSVAVAALMDISLILGITA